MPDKIDWLMAEDFNLMRDPHNRNRPGGDLTEMFVFNEAISALRLVDLPLQGRRFTWTNRQFEPLLERLDWFLTSVSWSLSYPNTTVSALVMETSDHALPVSYQLLQTSQEVGSFILKIIGWSTRIL